MAKFRVFVSLFLSLLLPTLVLAKDESLILPDVPYGHKDGMALTFDVFKPRAAPNGAAVVFLVSGGFASSYAPPAKTLWRFEPYLERGFTAFAVRHSGRPHYPVPDVVEDVRHAIRCIRSRAAEFGVDPERIGVWGSSSGGHLTLMLATASDDGTPDSDDPILRASSRIAAAVAWCPPVDFRNLDLDAKKKNNDPARIERLKPAFNFPVELRPSVSPILHVTADDAPTLLIHGDADTMVDVEGSRLMFAEFQRAGVAAELLILPGAAHAFEGADKTRAESATLAWLSSQLLKP